MTEQSLPEESIFLHARNMESAADRVAYLDQACGDNEHLRAEVQALLRADLKSGDLLDLPETPDATINLPITEGPSTVIGPYKLLQQIGEGGFGVVFMADQTEPVKRRVALKIIKPGMDTQQVTARFEAERQALAMMDHPNIAKVLDAGTTESGRPYFVMELVKGVPITQFCDENQLTTRERLELFLPVCQALQHAHQKGIIHRDIKPSNVMVAKYDDRPVPKVIDFGVVKAIEQHLTEKTMFTQFGQIVGTVDYMSPEQANLNQLDIDTRSDIYSLGVLLYELLTGVTPFDRQRLRSAAFDELLRIIREEEPPKPSLRLSSSEFLPSIAANRQIEPKKLSTLVRGELDWIVMKALEKNRARRYETANGFANDIQRYLSDEAVVACPPSAGYRFRKFARRNKRPLAVALCLTAAAIVASSFALVAHKQRLLEKEARLELRQSELDRREMESKAEKAERARRQHEQARLEAEQRAKELEAAEQEARFNALVEEAQRLSSGMYPNFLRAEELLTEAIEQRPAESRLYTYRGSARHELGKYEDAIADLERSLALRAEDNLVAHWLVAMAARQLGQERKARQHEVLATQQAPDSVESLTAQGLAMPYDERGIELLTQAIDRNPFDPALYFYRGRIAYNLTVRKTAKRHYDLAVSDLEKALRGRPHDTRIMETLCLCLVQFSHHLSGSADYPPSRAKQLLDEWQALEPKSISALPIVADFFRRADRLQDAIQVCEKGQELDPTRPEFPFFIGWCHIHQGEYDKALESLNQTLELRPQPYHHIYPMGYVDVHAVRAMVLAKLGQQDQAREALEVAKSWEPRGSWTFYDWHQLVVSYLTLQDFEEVVRWCDEWVQIAPECPRPYELRSQANIALSNFDEAAADLTQAIALGKKGYRRWYELALCHLAAGNVEGYREACHTLREVASKAEDPTAANFVAWTSALAPDAVDDYAPVLTCATKAVEARPDSDQFLNTLGAALYRAGRHENAIEWLTELGRSLENRNAKASSSPAYTWYFLAMVHKKAGNEDQARQYLSKAKAWTDEVLADEENPPAWNRRATLELLRTEAESLLAAPDVDTEPSNEKSPESSGEVKLSLSATYHWVFHCRRARRLAAEGNWTEAASAFSQAARLRPDDWELWKESAQTHVKLKQWDQAIEDYGQIIKLRPDDAMAYVHRARAHRHKGDYNKAMQDANMGLRIEPDHVGLLGERALAYVQLKQWDKAFADYNEALRRAPEDAGLYRDRGKAYLVLGRYDEALADYNSFVELRPDNEIKVVTRAALLLMTDRTDEYRQACVEILDRFAESEDPEVFCHAARACVLAPEATPDPMVPVELATRAVSRDPSESTFYTLGMAHLRAGQIDEAAQRFHESLNLNPNWNARFLNWLGLALVQHERGETAEARPWLGKAIESMEQHPAPAPRERIEGQLLRREAEQLLGKPEQESGAAKSEQER